MNTFSNMRLSRKLGFGFTLMAVIITGSILINTSQVRSAAEVSSRMIQNRVPTARAGLEVLNGINHALAALRGWMLLGNESFKADRAQAWSDEIWPAVETMRELSKSWTNPENVERLHQLEALLPEFERFQEEIEAIAQTRENVPSIKMLFDQAAPQAGIMVSSITTMIDAEASAPGTQERKALLGMMADVRGTTGLALANIRAFLLAGDDTFRTKFEGLWAKNERRFRDLSDNAHLLTREQAAAFDSFSKARAQFAPMPQQMMELRAADDWNVANHWLSSKAAPVGKQLSILLSEMSEDQKQLLGADATSVQEKSEMLVDLGWILLVVGIVFAALCGFFITRSVLRQLGADPARLQEVVTAIANDDLEMNLDTGKAATGVYADMQTMQQNLRSSIEKDRGQLAENGRIRQALGNVNSNVMIADNDLNIVYMNDAVTELFREAETDIRKDLPGFDASKLVGTCIDSFHKNPAHQRGLLASLNSTHTTEMKLGGRTLKIVANPVFSEDGTRLGSVVEWTDRTQELAIEGEVQQVVDSALAGNLSQRISLDDKDGFLERLSRGVNQLVGVAERVIEDTLRVFGAMATGDLTETIKEDYEGSFNQLKQDANATIAKLTEVVGGIQASSGSVKVGADEISQGNTDLSQRTEEQASSLEETASSMEEMTSTVRQNADNAAEANQLARAAREQAEKGGSVVSEAVRAMAEINASSKRIADIIGVIDEIAFQTNLLALNASVEAARAGDQGRGFAVVASEVRNLAGRSATAAKEIKDLIEDSGRKVDDGSRLVNESGETLTEIVNGVKKVTDIVGEIAAASEEQSGGIGEVNKAITQMDELTQQNAALVEEAAAASESLGEQADDLNKLMTFFTVDGLVGHDSISVSKSYPEVAERRSADRPWGDSNPAETMPPPAQRQLTADGSGQEWEEF